MILSTKLYLIQYEHHNKTTKNKLSFEPHERLLDYLFIIKELTKTNKR